MKALLCLIFCLLAGPAAAHGTGVEATEGFRPNGWIQPLLAFSALWYVAGLARLWRSAGIGKGIPIRRGLAFSLGVGVLVLALSPPLDALARGLFAAHMIEHEMLMAIAAPLLVLGSPAIAMLWALPRSARPALGRLGAKLASSGPLRSIGGPGGATVLHGAAIWVWHLPVLFNAALHEEGVHAAQHLSFLATALLFWWTLLNPRERARGYGPAVLYLFITAAHTSLLGALLVVASRLWYHGQNGLAGAWNMGPLEDQQLGGLIMWVPGGLVYALAALVMFALWLRSLHPRRMALEG